MAKETSWSQERQTDIPGSAGKCRENNDIPVPIWNTLHITKVSLHRKIERIL
jgi:hypothetical protein